jgi:hypothetical protein
MLIMKIRRKNYFWNIFVIMFSIFWVYWCYHFWCTYSYSSVFCRILNYVGIILLSPDMKSIYRVFFTGNGSFDGK